MSLKHVVLTVLAQKPATGYEIVKDFDDALGFFWNASHQQVYRELGELTEAGLVRFTAVGQAHRPDKKVYELTDAGRKALEEWVGLPVRHQPVRDEFLLKLLAGGLLGSSSLGKMVADERVRHQTQLATYRAIEQEHFSTPLEGLPAVERLLYMTLRRGILGEESWLKWAADLEEYVRTLEAGAPD